MRLNFWQWLGLILLIGAGGYWIYDKSTSDQPQQPQTEIAPPPATLPADPSTAPAAP